MSNGSGTKAKTAILTEDVRELIRLLQRTAHDFDRHLDELTAQLTEGQRQGLIESFDRLTVIFPHDLEAQVNACAWLGYRVKLREVDATLELFEELSEASSPADLEAVCGYCEHLHREHNGAGGKCRVGDFRAGVDFCADDCQGWVEVEP